MGLDLPPILDFDSWEQAGVKIARIADSSAWCLGDWLLYGQDRFPDRYRRAISAAGLDYQTLRNYAWVARKFELGRRREHLSFQHHAELAALSHEDQDRWLDAAEERGWSRNELRASIRMARHPGTAIATPLPKLKPPAEQLDRWREAAALQSQGLVDWIMATLDAGASHVLSARSTLKQLIVPNTGLLVSLRESPGSWTESGPRTESASWADTGPLGQEPDQETGPVTHAS